MADENTAWFEFDATIKASEIGKGGAFVEFPFDTEVSFGRKGRIPVVCDFEGIEYCGSLVRMGTPCHIVGVLKEIRETLGRRPGDTIRVRIREDTKTREKKST